MRFLPSARGHHFAAAAWFVLLGGSGCQGSLGRGVQAFGEARYPDAALELGAAEAELEGTEERARFELYAGLNHLALGNQRLAVWHLGRARRLLETTPELFSDDEQSRLFRAWRSLGRLPGQPL